MLKLLRKIHSIEKAQDAFEYLLVLGGISVVVVGAAALGTDPLIDLVVDGVESAIDGVLDIVP